MGDNKAVLTARFIETKSYIKKKKEMSEINNITLHSRNQKKKTKLSSQLADRMKQRSRQKQMKQRIEKKIEKFDTIGLIFQKR